MENLQATIDVLNVLGDSTRVRLLCVLERDELTVAELTAITELPQSRVSTHLGKLRQIGLLRDRKVGSSNFYTVNDASMPAEVARLWQIVRSSLRDGVIEGDRKRAEALRRARHRPGWPDSIAGEMERHYSPGRTWEATTRGLLGLLRLGDLLDVGSGDGAIAQLLAPRARSITLVDRSARMIEAAQRRLAGIDNARFCVGDMHRLPFDTEQFDAVLMLNVLSYAEEPERAVREAARVLRNGGTLALVTLNAHVHAAVTAGYGHIHPGFTTDRIRHMLERAELHVLSVEVTSRERRKPYFEVITAFAERRASRENA